MKVFFLMDSPEYLRFYDTAIDELASRGHRVTLAVMKVATNRLIAINVFMSRSPLPRCLSARRCMVVRAYQTMRNG